MKGDKFFRIAFGNIPKSDKYDAVLAGDQTRPKAMVTKTYPNMSGGGERRGRDLRS